MLYRLFERILNIRISCSVVLALVWKYFSENTDKCICPLLYSINSCQLCSCRWPVLGNYHNSGVLDGHVRTCHRIGHCTQVRHAIPVIGLPVIPETAITYNHGQRWLLRNVTRRLPASEQQLSCLQAEPDRTVCESWLSYVKSWGFVHFVTSLVCKNISSMVIFSAEIAEKECFKESYPHSKRKFH